MKTLLLVFLLAFGACSVNTTEIETIPLIFPEGAYEVEPPARYTRWFIEVAQCIDAEQMVRSAHSYNDITWYYVPGGNFVNPYTGQIVLGTYYKEWNYIFLAEDVSNVMWLVKHEMIHYFLRPRGGHPRPPYGACEVYL